MSAPLDARTQKLLRFREASSLAAAALAVAAAAKAAGGCDAARAAEDAAAKTAAAAAAAFAELDACTQQLLRFREASELAAAALAEADAAKKDGDDDAASAAEGVAARAGAKADVAFAEFEHDAWRDLLSCAFGVLRDHHLAEDATQCGLFRIARAVSAGQWDECRAAVSWSRQIVRNAAIDMRRERESQRRTLQSSVQHHMQRCNGEASPLETLLSAEFSAAFCTWLHGRLSDEEWQLLSYRYFEGMQVTTIGEKMNRATSTASRQLHGLLDRLRTLLAEDGAIPECACGEDENHA